jgi:hypothetical protein
MSGSSLRSLRLFFAFFAVKGFTSGAFNRKGRKENIAKNAKKILFQPQRHFRLSFQIESLPFRKSEITNLRYLKGMANG